MCVYELCSHLKVNEMIRNKNATEMRDKETEKHKFMWEREETET